MRYLHRVDSESHGSRWTTKTIGSPSVGVVTGDETNLYIIDKDNGNAGPTHNINSKPVMVVGSIRMGLSGGGPDKWTWNGAWQFGASLITNAGKRDHANAPTQEKSTANSSYLRTGLSIRVLLSGTTTP